MNCYIRSSSGRELVSIDFIRRYEDADGQIFLASKVEITGNFWGRFSKNFEGDVIEDFTVVLHQIRFWKGQLEEFLKQLKAWLQQPSQISIDLAVGPRSDQKFGITIGKHEECISSDEKPTCIIEYSSGIFHFGKWMFVLDQSCIHLLVEELSEALKESALSVN